MMAGTCHAGLFDMMERGYHSQKEAAEAGFEKEYIQAAGFSLMTYQRSYGDQDTIRIYIEGDGRAWERRNRLSSDPTPSDPVGLNLAIEDPSPSVAYIARPGQFPETNDPKCDPTYWSERRFSAEVITAFNEAIDSLKKNTQAKRIELTGYSGGAAIAVLVAASRSDVAALRTVAGNLDPKGLCAFHSVSQLIGSMDPMDFAEKVSSIPQRHFIGSDDRTVPPLIADSFTEKEGDFEHNSVTVVDGASHKGGWGKRWKDLLLLPLATIKSR